MPPYFYHSGIFTILIAYGAPSRTKIIIRISIPMLRSPMSMSRLQVYTDVAITDVDVSITGTDFAFTDVDVSITGTDVAVTDVDVSITGTDVAVTDTEVRSTT